MIYLDEQSEQKAQFESLLEQTKTSVLDQLKTIASPQGLSGADFELITFENAKLKAYGTPFQDKLVHTSDREFPDIVASGLFGVEVKATKKDDWTSIGNSVLESSRIDTVEKIYMFFGKLGGAPDIKYRNYEDCLRGISVTHYPRYQIDMLLDEDNSIFNKMGVDYDAIRSASNPVKTIRAYYRSQLKEGDALWWIGDDAEDMPSLSPIIKNFSSLDRESRDKIKAELFAFFPELFSESSKKYERIPAYLASQHGVVTANLRDNFTAGGQVDIKYNQETLRVPQVVGELLRLAPTVRSYLDGKTQVQLSNYWQKQIEDFSDAEEAWLREIDRISVSMSLPIKISELYISSFANQDSE